MPRNYVPSSAAYTTTVSTIADNDPLSEKYLAPGLRRLADNLAYLYRKRASSYSFGVSGAQAPIGLGPSGYGYLLTPIITLVGAATQNTIAAGIFVDVPNCAVGDTVLVAGVAQIVSTATSTGYEVTVNAIDNYGATSPAGPETRVSGAHFGLINSFLDGTEQNIELPGSWTVMVPGTTRFAFGLRNNGSTTLKLDGCASLRAMRFPL